MKIAVITGLFAKRNMNIYAGQGNCFKIKQQRYWNKVEGRRERSEGVRCRGEGVGFKVWGIRRRGKGG